MKTNICGVPLNIVIRWILNCEFKNAIGNWADLGCGDAKFLSSIQIIPNQGAAVDIKRPPKLPPNFVFSGAEINRWLNDNTNRRFDLITMFEVVEHFKKEQAIDLICKSAWLSNALLISTPSGFLRQNAETHPEYSDNLWQWHRCGFEAEEFTKMGFFVFVLKNYHLKPVGNSHSFDAILCYKKAGYSVKDYKFLSRKIKIKFLIYNFNPLHFYRTIRQLIKSII